MNGDPIAFDRLRPVRGAEDRREPVLAGDDRRVRHDPTDVRDGCLDAREHGRPARRGRRADEDLARLHLIEVGDGGHDAGRPLDDARGRCHPAQLVRPPAAVRAFLRVEPGLDALRRDPPEHDRDRLVLDLRRRPERERRRPRAQALHDPLALGDLLRPVVRAARRGGPDRPAGQQVVERVVDLVAVQVEDVLRVVEEPVRAEDLAELADAVPEDRVVPVLDVEVVVLDVRIDAPREADELVERGPVVVGREQLAVLARDPLALRDDLVERPVDLLAGLELLDVAAERVERHRQIVHPGAVVV
jgi:hypothetical protein